MKLITFLNNLEKQQMPDYSVVCFTGASYPLLFFSLLFKLKIFSTQHMRKIDAEQLDNAGLKSSLQIPFLGSTILYWFGDIKQISPAKAKSFLQYMQTYQGPHAVWFFVDQWDQQKNNSHCVVSLDELSKEDCFEIIRVFMPADYDFSFIAAVMEKKSITSLDEICLLLQYCSLLSKKQIPQFIEHWLDKIIAPERSLFTLSTHFFAQKPALFFPLWNILHNDYPPAFWLAFWSDQLFRATNFITLMKKNMQGEAKKIAYKLPFTFIKRDWQKITVSKLNNAHDVLYHLDYSIKQGGSEQFLNLFFAQFFEKNS